MNNFVRALIAGWGAKKLGGGCVGTIVAFVIIYYALGTCNSHPVQTTAPQRNSFLNKQKKEVTKKATAYYTLTQEGESNVVGYTLQK